MKNFSYFKSILSKQNLSLIQKKRYPELDALRGFAALYVVLFHYTIGQDAANLFFRLGVTAVDLFFLISGFVIFMSLNAVSSGREFVINRVSRLYPTYWACVTISFGAMTLLKLIHFKMNHTSNANVVDYLGNMTMFQYYLNIHDLEIPYWTMIIEMLFYLFMVVIFQFKLTKYISTIGCILNGLILLNYILVTGQIIPNYTHYFPLLNHFALFFAGIMFYQIIHNLQSTVVSYCIIFFCLITQVTIFRFAGSAPDHISFYQYAVAQIFYFIIFMLFVNDKLKFLITRPTVFLGKISFALYLVHAFLFIGLIGYLQKHYHFHFWLAVGFALPLAIAFAAMITKYVERPYHQRLKRFLLR